MVAFAQYSGTKKNDERDTSLRLAPASPHATAPSNLSAVVPAMKTIFPVALFLTSCLIGVFASSAHGEAIEIAKVSHSGKVDFEKEILPIFRRNCLACHNATEAESDLVLESPQTIAKGGADGPTVVIGKSAESLLLKLAAHQDEPVMPPEDNDVGAKNLTSQELGLIKLWIDQGAAGTVTGADVVNWQPLPPGVNSIYSAAISADGRFAAAGRANQIFVYHVPSKQSLGRLTDPALLEKKQYENPGVAHLDLVQSLAFSPDGEMLASGGYKTVKLWQRESAGLLGKIAGLASSPTTMAISASREFAAAGQADGSVKLVDIAGKKVIQSFKLASGPVTAVAISSDGEQIAAAAGNTYQVWKKAGAAVGEPFDTGVAITALAFVAENRRLATGQADSKIRVWEVEPEAKPAPEEKPAEGDDKPAEEAEKPAIKPVVELAGHSAAISSLTSFGDKSEFLLSGSADKTVRHWNAETGQQIRSMTHNSEVTQVAVGAGAAQFVAIGANPAGRIFNAANGAQIAEFKGNLRTAYHVDSLTRSAALAKRHIDASKKDLEEGQKRKKSEEDNLKKGEESVKTTGEEAKKKAEAAKKPIADKEEADKNLKAKEAELAAAEKKKTETEAAFKTADEAMKAAQAKRDEANKGEDDNAKKAAEDAFKKATEARQKADTDKNAAVAEFNKINGEVNQLKNRVKQLDTPATKARDERDAAERASQAAIRSVERAKQSVKKATDAIPGLEQMVKTYEALQTKLAAELEQAKKAQAEEQKNLIGLAVSADGKSFAVSDESQTIRTWDLATGAPLEVIETKTQGGNATHLAYAADGTLLSTNSSAEILVWNVSPQFKLVKTIGGFDSNQFEDRVTALDFSSDGSQLATGGGQPSRNGELKIWDVASGSLKKEFPDAHSDTIFGVAFSPDDTVIATCGADRFGKVFEAASGKLVRSFEGHTHHVLDISWSADGRIVATSGADKVVKVWDYRTGDQKRTVTGFGKEVTSIEFVADGANFVTASGDKNVSLKRADNGGNIRNFGGNTDFVYTTDASADGKIIIAGGEDSILRVWTDAGQIHASFEPPKEPVEEAPAS